MKKLVYFLILGTAIFQGCKDDPVDPDGNNGNNNQAKTCRLLGSVDDQNATTTLTWANDLLQKIVEKDSFETVETVFSYDGTKLLTATIDSYNQIFTMGYTGDRITSVVMTEDGLDDTKFEITYNSNGKIAKVEEYYANNPGWVLYQSYEFTWSGDNVTEMLNKWDDDDDGSLESETTVTLTQYDNKHNPFYGLPVVWTNLDNPINFSKNNAAKMTAMFGTTPFEITQVMEYNSDGYPTKITTTIPFFGTSVATMNYDCK